jgi:hypothetical protein
MDDNYRGTFVSGGPALSFAEYYYNMHMYLESL